MGLVLWWFVIRRSLHDSKYSGGADTLAPLAENQVNNAYFVGWGTLSLINAGLAQSKGHQALTWWMLSLLLGPIATLFIVVLPRGDAAKLNR